MKNHNRLTKGHPRSKPSRLPSGQRMFDFKESKYINSRYYGVLNKATNMISSTKCALKGISQHRNLPENRKLKALRINS